MHGQRHMRVIGLMSGTSLDGLDICLAEFDFSEEGYWFQILAAETVPYPENWLRSLRESMDKTSDELAVLDQEYGDYLGDRVNDFMQRTSAFGKVDLIASHGHTVFHQPARGITLQIGAGDRIHRVTGIPVINDFRRLDVELGGQGAPLVPVGDHFLFSEYAACLNLGGFSNISFVKADERIAFDIAPCNLPLNRLMQDYLGKPYDAFGATAASGKLIPELYAVLGDLPFYQQSPPKSLGAEWLNGQFMPLLKNFENYSVQDLMHTLTLHIADIIAGVLEKEQLPNVLVTGGGAYNKLLISKISEFSQAKIVVPSPQIVEFKEALIFAFLGYLNFNNSINTFKSVTGARENSMGGIRHFSH